MPQDNRKCPCCGRSGLVGRAAVVADMAVELGIGCNSGFRCPAHNSAVGGVSDSQHLRGVAVDLPATPPVGPMYTAVLALIAASRPVYVKWYPWGCHLDWRGL